MNLTSVLELRYNAIDCLTWERFEPVLDITAISCPLFQPSALEKA